ncbi:MAG: porin family protein [Rhizobiaceae bacterium]|nr:porin family protein [Rhizobiaceae bacterium]
MLKNAKPVLLGAAFAAAAWSSATAADLYEPPVYETPPPVYETPAVEYGGWYIRGDIDYHWSKFGGADYITYGPPPGSNSFDFGNFRGALSLGAGVGYKVSKYFRTDLTADWMFRSKFTGQTTGTCAGAPCVSVDESSYSALLLLANAYADLGTYHGVTPYIGAGIGGAHVKWGDLRNTITTTTTVHRGASEWRFAWALMAGASYCLTKNLNLDVGYRYSRISGGRMFEYANFGGPGFDKGINVHEVRGGLRYQFGGSSGCGEKEVVTYDPEPPVVYK